MFTQPGPSWGQPSLEDVEKARAAGVPWTELIQGVPAVPPSPEQLWQARCLVQFRSWLGADEDEQTMIRAAVVLRSPGDAPLRQKMWGLPDDPEDPAAADFSDVARALDQRAAVIHQLPPDADGGRHARPPLALPPGPTMRPVP